MLHHPAQVLRLTCRCFSILRERAALRADQHVHLLFSLFFFSSRRRHTRCLSDWSSDVCSSDLAPRSGGSAMGFSRGPGPSANFGNRSIGGGNFATNGRQSFAARGNWNGRRNFSDFRRHRGFRGPAFAFGFGPSYYDYGYYDDYYPYDDGAYAYVEPGVDSSAYCAQRFRSYDPSTGTYLGYDGLRHPCP